MTVTAAMLANRLTPSGYAEEAYQARKDIRAARRVAVSAGGLPPAAAVYRPTLEGKLLNRLATAGYAVLRKAADDPAERERATSAIVADLHRRFPQADMDVLARYGFADECDAAIVDMPDFRVERLLLGELVLLPRGAARYAAAERGSDKLPLAPDAARSFLGGLATARSRSSDVQLILLWPGQFKVEHGRWPRWGEIERAWPVLADQLRRERGE